MLKLGFWFELDGIDRDRGELLAIVTSTAVLIAVPVEVLWEAAIHASAVWLTNGLVLLFMAGCAVRVTLRRGRRPARRLRAAIAGAGKRTAA